MAIFFQIFFPVQVRTPTVNRTTQRWADAIEMGEPQESMEQMRGADEGTHYWATLTWLRRACFFLSTAGMLLITQTVSWPCESGSTPNTMNAALDFVLQSMAPI